MATVSSLLDWDFLCFLLTYELNSFKSRVNTHSLSVGFLALASLYTLDPVFFLFLVTPCLAGLLSLALSESQLKRNYPCFERKFL